MAQRGNSFDSPDRGFCVYPEYPSSRERIQYKCNHCLKITEDKVRRAGDTKIFRLNGRKCRCAVGYLRVIHENIKS